MTILVEIGSVVMENTFTVLNVPGIFTMQILSPLVKGCDLLFEQIWILKIFYAKIDWNWPRGSGREDS